MIGGIPLKMCGYKTREWLMVINREWSCAVVHVLYFENIKLVPSLQGF